MQPELTSEEELALRRVVGSPKWGYLTNLLTVLLPCVLIGGIGVWNDSALVVAGGGLTFLMLVVWNLPRQMKQQSHLKSAIQKLNQMRTANKAPDTTR